MSVKMRVIYPALIFLLFSHIAQSAGMDYPPVACHECDSFDLVVNQQGNPVIAWGDMDHKTEKSSLMVRQWNGSRWEQLAETGLAGSKYKKTGIFSYTVTFPNPRPSLKIDPSNHPIVACNDVEQISLKSWDGSKWIELDQSASNGGISKTYKENEVSDSEIALDSDGYPYVIWNYEIQKKCFLRFWNGTSWEELGDSAHGIGLGDIDILCHPKIALNKQDCPILVWHGKTIPQNFGMWDGIFLKVWDEKGWKGLGGSDLGRGLSKVEGLIRDAALVLDAADNPIVAWNFKPFSNMESKSNRIYLLKWNGKEWTELGGSATDKGIGAIGDSYLEKLSIALDEKGRPIIACSNNSGSKIYLWRWDGARWIEPNLRFGPPANNAFSYPVIKTNKGNLIIAWIDHRDDSAASINDLAFTINVRKIELQ